MKMPNRESEDKMTILTKTRHEYHETSLQEKTAKNKTKPPNPSPQIKPENPKIYEKRNVW